MAERTPLLRGGVACALKYRLPNEPGSPYDPSHPRQAAPRALRLVRGAREQHLDDHRLGRLGFSSSKDLVQQSACSPCAGDPQAAAPLARQNARLDFQLLSPDGEVAGAQRRPPPPSSPDGAPVAAQNVLRLCA